MSKKPSEKANTKGEHALDATHINNQGDYDLPASRAKAEETIAKNASTTTNESEPKEQAKGEGGRPGDRPGDAPATTDANHPANPDLPSRVYESKAQAGRRWEKEGRAGEVAEYRDLVRAYCREAGMRQNECREVAWYAAFCEWPCPPPEPKLTIETVPPLIETEADDVAPPIGDGQIGHRAQFEPDQGISGLGDIPAEWDLAPTSSLAADIEWCQHNRLLVVLDGGNSVDLSRASTPPPSMSTLSWLETSLRAYTLYCQTVAKVAGQQGTDDSELVQRERKSVAEVRDLLKQMVDSGS